MVGIYKITNLINGKIYIGQSINIQQRWKAHRARPFYKEGEQYQTPLYRAIRKYGLQNFSFEVIEECFENQLNEKEQYYIEYYDTTNQDKGYNLTKGGQAGSVDVILDDLQVKEIYDLLINSNFTETEIANKYNVSQRYISGINLGQYRIQPGYTYPLLKHRQKEEKRYYCKKCGTQIASYKANLCVKCAKEETRVVERPSREELKKEIRTNSFLALSRKYQVSDTAIRKWCKAYNLPHQKTLIQQISDEDWSKI